MTTTKKANRLVASAWIAVAVASAAPIVALAQIEEVVVTTRKREENLQDIPLAVSAISAEQIQRQGINSLADVVQNQPSVKFDQSFGPADNRITVRGLSNTRGRSNVAFLIDGIDVTTENLISAGSGLLANRRLLSDVERIEVVKGPQSALFGRSAFAGALSYITKEPGDEFEGRVNLDVGDYGRRTVDGGISGPLTDTISLAVSGVQFNEDGYYTNSQSGADVGGSDGVGGALTAMWRPTDAVKIKGRLETSKEHYDPRAVVNLQGDTPVYLDGPLMAGAQAIVKPIIASDVYGQQVIDYNNSLPTPVNAPVTTQDWQKGSSGGTNLFNFGTYCPKSGFDPLNITGRPGFCLPRNIGSANGQVVSLSEDPTTGGEFPGTDTRTFRASLLASIDLGYGLVSSYTGWTDFNSTDVYDQDYQASSAPDFNGNGQIPYTYDANGNVLSGRRDTLMGQQGSNQETDTKQFSQEFRYETQWDGPWKLTGGVLYWQDHRLLKDKNNIISCSPFSRNLTTGSPLLDGDGNPVLDANGSPVIDPTTGSLAEVPGLCDGSTVTYDGLTAPTLTSWQDVYRQIGVYDSVRYPNATPGATASTWDATTRHWSFYARVDWALTDELNLSIEDRFVNEESSMTKPSGSSCSELAFAAGSFNTGTRIPWLDQTRTLCDNERVMFGYINNEILTPPNVLPIELTWRYIEGSTSSSYNTPKLTLDWSPIEDTKLFFSYAYAQKPGGINALIGGGASAPPTIENERFDPEKLKAYELGLKTQFEAAGFWQFNSSLFLQDYTAKQVSIQVLDSAGVANPRVVNASGAEVWGFEFETIWQPEFMEGLLLSLSGTLLDASYTDWTDDTRNLVRAAAYGSCPLVYKYTGRDGVEQVAEDPADITIEDTSRQQNGQYDNDGINAGDAQPVAYCRLDYAGNDLERTPTQSYAASMRIQRPFLDTPYEYLFELSGSWQSERWAEPENLVEFDSYALMDLRIGLVSDQWEVIAYVDNVLDDDTFKTGGSGPDFGDQVTDLGFTAGLGTTHYFANMPDPRVFGIRAGYRFGAGR
jgi:outer membrane receptor protein involved in Fe transport